MPLVGLGGYVLSRHGRHKPMQTPLTTAVTGDFFRVIISPFYDKIKGRLFLNFHTYHISYDGIKVRLNVHLKSQCGTRRNSDIELFEHCPIETTFPCGEFRGHKKLDFTLIIPKDRNCPTSFISSNGSLTYRLVALIKRDKNDPWTIIGNKLLLDFKGYHDVSGMELAPSVDFKVFLEGKITSIFTINNPVLLVGRGTHLNATLELQGVLDNNVDVTLTFLRKTKCGDSVQTEIISLQRQQSNRNEDSTIFEWNVDAPLISKATYANDVSPFYSVRYFIKYEASFKPWISDEKAICVDGHGIIEVKVGTTTESYAYGNSCASTMTTDRVENETQIARHNSVTSMITLPPAYSQLSSRSGSLLSLETQPPNYDDL